MSPAHRIAARTRAGRHRPSVRLAGLLAIATLGALGAIAPPGGAVTGTPTVPAQEGQSQSDAATSPRPNEPSQPAGPSIELVSQPSWVHGGELFAVDVDVSAAPAGAALDMVVHDRLESRRGFQDTLGGDLGGTEHAVAPEPLAAPPAGTDGEATIGFVAGPGGVGLSGTGVYPVAVRLLGPGGEVLDTVETYLALLARDTPEFPPLEVAVLVDISAPPTLRPDGTSVLPDDAFARARERVDVLERTRGVALTLAPTPETIEGLATAGPISATLVEQLRDEVVGQPVVARPFVEVDPAALERANLTREINTQADDGANVVRDRLGVEPVGGMWISGPTLGPAAARLAADLGLDRAVVPPSAIIDDGDDERPSVPAAPVRLGDDGPLAMVSDPMLAAHLTADDGAVAAHRFLAELAITWLEAPSIPRAVVVHIPPEAALDPDVVSVALQGLADGQAVQATPLDRIFTEVPPLEEGPTTIEVAPHEISDRLGDVARALGPARSRVTGVGALLDDPDLSRSLEHSLLLSMGSATPSGERLDYIRRVGGALDEVAGVVTLPEEFRITLTSRESTIPVTLTSLSDEDLTVRVELESDQLEFLEDDVLTEPLAARSTTRIEVPVRTRTSGAFTMEVTVTSPDGTIVLDRTTFDVRSTTISGVGIVLSVGACLFLAVWWARHWRSARRSRRLIRPDDGGEPALAGPAAERPDAEGEPPPPAEPDDDPDYQPAHMARPRSPSG